MICTCDKCNQLIEQSKVGLVTFVFNDEIRTLILCENHRIQFEKLFLEFKESM